MRPIDADALLHGGIRVSYGYHNTDGRVLVPIVDVRSSIRQAPTIDAVLVVRCKDCQKCTVWEDGHSFTCSENETDYYAPTYDAATYYCADGKPKEEPCT